jgi:hypothetical protein
MPIACRDRNIHLHAEYLEPAHTVESMEGATRIQKREQAMKAKLLCDAGKIHEGTAVEIVSKAGTNYKRRRAKDVGGPSTRPEPAYAVKDTDGHAEVVDTRDLELVR